MIWLPDGDEIPDREKHMIQSPKLMRTFFWNPDGSQAVDGMSCYAKRRDVHATYDIRNILTEIVARPGVERET
jgi:hypothetical protein